MKVLVTGATGFVGRHVVKELLRGGHSVVALARDVERAKAMPWHSDVEFVACDLTGIVQPVLERCRPEALIHLAWSGLPNFRSFFHIEKNLPADMVFLKACVDFGLRQVMVAGTCLEYGLQFGPLTEDMETRPRTPYGFAKDSLRKTLQFLQRESPFQLQWMRLFYMYGEGQNENSLLASLDRAIDRGDAVFNMSAGDQLRDYLSIDEVAQNFLLALESPEQCEGVVNCCSGRPISVFDLVRQRCEERSSSIRLNRGYYDYPDYEPLAFWGIPDKLETLTRMAHRRE
ncbi:MAG TPA: NAD-dependent epimerase/dehydratase family protein [Rhodopseudomonas sp.]|uniref:NAD-dependent epimerase/dehydratase family protein n=1 Tax=Rhodopseudomonas sp. TaxID=1078 RepID=UPI002EDAE339